jgi:hypothetical protein
MARHWTIRGRVGSWQAGAVNDPADVRTVQEMLTIVSRTLNNAHNFSPFAISGTIEEPPAQSKTVKAIVAFHGEVLGMAKPDGVVEPNGATFKGLHNIADSNLAKYYVPPGVDAKLRAGILHLVAHVGSAVVTSGKRTVEEQVDAMLKMDSDRLEMYCKGGTADYVTKLRALMASKKYTRENIIQVVNEAVKNKHRISYHLKGLVVDISDRRGQFRRPPQSLANKYGVRIYNCSEVVAMHCCHLQLIHTAGHHQPAQRASNAHA